MRTLNFYSLHELGGTSDWHLGLPGLWAALQKTNACANIPLWNSEIVDVTGERAFEIPTRPSHEALGVTGVRHVEHLLSATNRL